MWADGGFVIRLPESDRPPDSAALLPSSASIHDQVMRQLGSTALFAARFRENAARALLLPRRRPGVRTPLWQQRKRSADLLNVASRYPSFAMLLETYRECIRDTFDLPALVEILRRVECGAGFGSQPWIRRSPRLSLPRCSSAMWPITFMTAMRRLPNGVPRRSPSIRRNCKSCWEMLITAKFSMAPCCARWR